MPTRWSLTSVFESIVKWPVGTTSIKIQNKKKLDKDKQREKKKSHSRQKKKKKIHQERKNQLIQIVNRQNLVKVFVQASTT